MNAPRLAYVMQSSVGPTRQLLITPTSSPVKQTLYLDEKHHVIWLLNYFINKIYNCRCDQ